MCVCVCVGVSLLPCAVALVFSACMLYLWHVYRRRFHYIQTKLQEAELTMHVTFDVQSHTDSANQAHTGKLQERGKKNFYRKL